MIIHGWAVGVTLGLVLCNEYAYGKVMVIPYHSVKKKSMFYDMLRPILEAQGGEMHPRGVRWG